MMMLINCQHACLKVKRIVKVKLCIRDNTATNVFARKITIMELQWRLIKTATRSIAGFRYATLAEFLKAVYLVSSFE